MVDLPHTLAFATLLSTQRCAGGHYRPVASTFASTHTMPSFQLKNSETWLVVITPPRLTCTYIYLHSLYTYTTSLFIITIPCYIHYFQLRTQLRTYAALAQARPTMSCILLVLSRALGACPTPLSCCLVPCDSIATPIRYLAHVMYFGVRTC